jgi:hypothetical protein
MWHIAENLAGKTVKSADIVEKAVDRTTKCG